MENYPTLAAEANVEVIIKKSRFLGLASPISSPDAAEQRLAALRAVHSEASHHVFAYVLAPRPERSDWTLSRMSDDGEPSGTAGRPVMGVLERSALQDVLVVVTRYFGGTLLGASGLVRAYTRAAAQALAQAPVMQLVRSFRYRWQVPYALYGSAMNLLSHIDDVVIEGADFAAEVNITFTAPAERRGRIEGQLNELVQGQLIWACLDEIYLGRGER